MRRRKLATPLLAVLLASLSACSSHQLRWAGATIVRGTVDSLLGFPVLTVVTGAGDALESGNADAHEREVRDIAGAYEAFTEDRLSARLPETGKSSLVINMPGHAARSASD